ncbi:MAG TPA: L-rhamnose mutarotase [Solirubrobacteraceae bacterium]|nr:L-rhamnose mutarotase [Solirubrobacteraceae bacterium]
MGQFHAIRTRLRPGMEQAYQEAHDTVWPSLIEAQREAGIAGWWIFRSGLDLFHVSQCDDFDRALAVLAAHPVDQLWQAEMALYTESELGRAAPAAERLQLIYHR